MPYVFEYTQEQGDTWELAEIIIIGEQTNSWTTGTGKALNLTWSLGDETHTSDTPGKWFSGQYYHGSTRQLNFMTNASNYFRMTAVQLEVGKGKTPFDDIGYESMLGDRSTGSNNIGLGNRVMYNITTGSNNIGLGKSVL